MSIDINPDYFTQGEADQVFENYISMFKKALAALAETQQEMKNIQSEQEEVLQNISCLERASAQIVTEPIGLKAIIEKITEWKTHYQTLLLRASSRKASIEIYETQIKVLKELCPHPKAVLKDLPVHPHKGEEWSLCLICGKEV